MCQRNWVGLFAVSVAGAWLAAAAAFGAPLQSITTTNANFNGLAVSNTDLLQTHLGSTIVTGYSPFFLGSDTFGNPNPVLINGSSQGNTTAPSDWPNLVLEDTTGGRDANWSATFNLDLSKSPGGYNISEVNTFSGWSDARAGQSYSLFLSKVGDPAFTQVLSGLGGSLGDAFGVSFSNGASKIAITDPGNLLGTAIDAIRFDVTGAAGTSGPVLREFDVIGVATPEPASLAAWAIVGLASLGMAIRARRRKSRKIGQL